MLALLPGALRELLGTGQISVATPAQGNAPMLLTRIGLSGDVSIMVDRRFARAPDPALVRLHAARVRRRLAELRRMEPALRLISVALGHLGTAPVLFAPAGSFVAYGDAVLQMLPPELAALPLLGAGITALLVGGALAVYRAVHRVLRGGAARLLVRAVRRRMTGFASRTGTPRTPAP
jgi:hypothetical protein